MESLEQSLDNTLATSDLTKINVELAEITLDKVLNDSTLKELPIFSTILGLANFGIKTRELLLLKKVFKFLTQLSDIPIKSRQRFVERIEKNEPYNKRVGLAIILLLDKLEDLEKPVIIGKLLAANIKGIIDYQMFLRLSYLIQVLFLPDLEYVRKAKEGYDIGYEKEEELFRVGMMKIADSDGIRFDGRNTYEINSYAMILLDIIGNH